MIEDKTDFEKIVDFGNLYQAYLKSKSSNANKPDAFWIAEGKCPRCHSDNIQLVPRKWSIWTGYRTNAVSRICLNCKHRF